MPFPAKGYGPLESCFDITQCDRGSRAAAISVHTRASTPMPADHKHVRAHMYTRAHLRARTHTQDAQAGKQAMNCNDSLGYRSCCVV